MEATQIPLPGTLAWPGDLDLLAKYGVTTNQIAARLSEIFMSINSQTEERVSKSKKDPYTISIMKNCNVGDQFEVKVQVFLQGIKKIQCAYCKQMQEHNADYTIKSIHTNDAMLVPNIMLHLISEHGDLGDPGSYRITPTQACKVLGLGDTSLDEGDPLLQLVKFSNWGKEQLEQKKADDETLMQLELSSDQVATRLNEIVEKGEAQLKSIYGRTGKYKTETIVDDRFQLCWDRCLGYQHCHLCEPPKEFPGFGDGTIQNLNSGKTIKISTLVLHSISEHEYFAKNPQHRIDPKKAVEVLELGK